MNKITDEEILKLSVDERFDLIDRIWDTIAADPEVASLIDDQRELDRRLADAGSDAGVDEVNARRMG